MKIQKIAEILEGIAPLELAQDWDNVGLLVGDNNKNIRNIMLAIDVTSEVVSEAKKLKTDLIISYHPIIWDGLKKITKHQAGSNVYELIRSNISVYSIHTALDAAWGGVNDGLAEIIGIENPAPIGDFVQSDINQNYKLVASVPRDSLSKVTDAIFQAGQELIGNYSKCSFQNSGTGTFLPLEGSSPAIGKKGRLEKVEEIRFESIVPAEKLDRVLKAMRNAHPYEEPAYDVIKLFNDRNKFGLGRIGNLKKRSTIDEIIKQIKKQTGAKAVGLVGKNNRLVKKAAVCAGSCGKIINMVISEKCDLYLTGELKHHQALAAKEAGLTCLCLSHTVSERFILKKLAKLLKKQLKEVKIIISKKDVDPFEWKQI